MPPRPSIPFEEVQLNDTVTELTGPENTQEQVGSSNPILIGQLRMIQAVSASDSFEETPNSSSDDSYSEDSEVTRDERRQIEHARYFHDCAFAQQIQKREFINLAKKRTANLNDQEHQEVNGTLHKYTGDSTTAQEDEENVMMSPAVTSIKKMGYSEGKIKAAINKIKSRQPRGNNSVSAKEILEVIFELNGSGASDSLRKEHALYDTTISESVMENTTFYMRYPTPSEEGKILSTNDPDIAAEGTIQVDYDSRYQ